MEPIEAAAAAASAGTRVRRFRTAGLLAIVLILVASSFISLRSTRSRSTLDAAQLQVDTLIRARSLYSLRTLSGHASDSPTTARERALIRDLSKLADVSPTPRNIRRLALTQYVFHDNGWRSSLLRLRSVPGADATFGTERELSTWAAVLDGHARADDIPDIERRIDAMNLGWYEHFALAALYRGAGDAARASRQVEAANGSTTRLLTILNLAVLAGLAGIVVGIRQLVLFFRRRARTRSSAYEFVSAEPPLSLRPLIQRQADVLYMGFVIYLATFAVVRLVIGDIFGRFISRMLAGFPPEVDLSVQIAISLLSLAPTLIWLVAKGRRAGLTAASIGLTTRDLPANVVWGITGYAVALPLVYLASVLSSWVFRSVQSPPHPVIAELVATRGPLFLVLMFLQVAVIPPFSEELMFRGVFFRALSARMAAPAAVILTSALFAILHPQLPLGFLGIFVLGMIFNLLALSRGSLVPGMVAHALNNGVIFFFFVLLTSD